MRGRRSHYLRHREVARSLVRARVEYYARLYGVAPKKIFIKNLKSRWGSCSSRGNLNFHYKLALLPEPLRDYVVVHEVCHLREFNHGPKFWTLVAREIPLWKQLRKELHSIH